MRKLSLFFALLLSLGVLVACGKSSNSASDKQKIVLKMNRNKYYNVDAVKGTATKGSTVIFEPHNKDNDVEKIDAGVDDGFFAEDALLPGTYTVYAKLHNKKSAKQTLKILDYSGTHSTPDDEEQPDDSDDTSTSESIEDSVSSSLSESASKSNDQNSSTGSSYKSQYKRVSIDDFVGDPDKYDQKFIKVTGNVTYIQRNSDNDTMDYVVLSNNDNTAATVTEIEVEDIHSHHISEGSSITVLGGGLTKTVELNGKTLESDIIVDFVQ